MKEQMLDEVIARRFLLGQLPPEEQGRIEELAFDDPQSFELLQSAEDDLIDEFVYDDLSSEERERFQEYYLAQPGRREDLRIATALREYFDREQPVPSLWEQLRTWIGATPLIPLMAKAAVIIAAAVIGLVTLIPRIIGPGVNPLPQIAQQQPSPIPSPTVSETPSQPSPPPAPSQNKPPSPHRLPTRAYALLSPGTMTRGDGEVITVSLRSKTHFVLPLIDEPSYRSYHARLEQDGTTLATWSNLKPARIISGKGFRIRIPSEKLRASQRYHIILEGVGANGSPERVEEYYFDATN